MYASRSITHCSPVTQFHSIFIRFLSSVIARAVKRDTRGDEGRERKREEISFFRFLRYTQPSQGRMGERFFFILFIHSDFYEILFPLNFSLFFFHSGLRFFLVITSSAHGTGTDRAAMKQGKNREKEGAREEE